MKCVLPCSKDRYYIPLSSLATLMQKLNLFAEEEYVELMRSKMDSEGLGIILIHQVNSSFLVHMYCFS